MEENSVILYFPDLISLYLNMNRTGAGGHFAKYPSKISKPHHFKFNLINNLVPEIYSFFHFFYEFSGANYK